MSKKILWQAGKVTESEAKQKLQEIRRRYAGDKTEWASGQRGRCDGIEAGLKIKDADKCDEVRAAARSKFQASKRKSGQWEYWSAYLSGLSQGFERNIL